MARQCFNVGLLIAASACLFCANALLYPPGQPWTYGFDPPYDDSTLSVQLKIYDWWTTVNDTAILPKGTPVPIVDNGCDPSNGSCPTWTVPGDIAFQFATPTIQAAHRLSET